MNIAIVGCGYVAEFYGKTLGNYPDLRFVGAYDQNAAEPAKILPTLARPSIFEFGGVAR